LTKLDGNLASHLPIETLHKPAFSEQAVEPRHGEGYAFRGTLLQELTDALQHEIEALKLYSAMPDKNFLPKGEFGI
jgi:hypothetical protein